MRRDASLDRLGDYSDESLLRELRRVAQLLEKDTLTMSDIDAHARCCYAVLKKRFGGLRPALIKAGLASPPLHRRLSDEELLDELGRIWDVVLEAEGRRPYRDDLTKYRSRFSSGTYEDRWGSWIKACEALLARSEDTTSVASRRNEPDPAPASIRTGRAKRPIPLGLRYDVLKRDDFRCVLCGRSPATNPGLKLHVDHIVPESSGGPTTLENLRALCDDCNVGRGVARDEVGQRGTGEASRGDKP
jgi:5-methylcytosine-specific restriction endonuclease McrA